MSILKPNVNHRAYVGSEFRFDQHGQLMMDSLRHFGLKKNHKVLDIGCGPLRLGRKLIPVLNKGCYYGIDPNVSLIQQGIQRELSDSQRLMKLKKPQFAYSDQFEFSVFHRKFDFLIAYSIFTHAADWQIEKCLAEASRVMKRSSVFLATFRPGERNYRGTRWKYPDLVKYRPDFFSHLAEETGFEVECWYNKGPLSRPWLRFSLR